MTEDEKRRLREFIGARLMDVLAKPVDDMDEATLAMYERAVRFVNEHLDGPREYKVSFAQEGAIALTWYVGQGEFRDLLFKPDGRAEMIYWNPIEQGGVYNNEPFDLENNDHIEWLKFITRPWIVEG